MKAKRKHIAQPEDEINLFTKPQNSPPSHRQCYTEASLLSWGLLRWHFQYRRAEGSPHGSQLQEGKGKEHRYSCQVLAPRFTYQRRWREPGVLHRSVPSIQQETLGMGRSVAKLQRSVPFIPFNAFFPEILFCVILIFQHPLS